MPTKVIAVAGGSGSGKTTISKKLQKHYGTENCVIISLDSFYNDLSDIPEEERCSRNFDHPDSIDFDLFFECLNALINPVLDASGVPTPVKIPAYNFKTHSREKDTVFVSSKPVIIVEGILALHVERLNPLYDYKIFVDTDPETRLIRRTIRDVETRGRTYTEVFQQYLATVKPMYDEYVARCMSSADIVIHNSETLKTTGCEDPEVLDVSALGEYLAKESETRAKSEAASVFCNLFSWKTLWATPQNGSQANVSSWATLWSSNKTNSQAHFNLSKSFDTDGNELAELQMITPFA